MLYKCDVGNCIDDVCCRAIGKMMLILLWPLFPFLLQLGVVAYWVTSALYPLAALTPWILNCGC